MADAKTKVVPLEPTPEMRGAFHRAQYLIEEGDDAANSVGSPDFQWQQMLSAAPQPAASDVPHDVVRIAEVIDEAGHDGACAGWRSCTGCHETNEGAETGHYPYSKAFGCYLGSGCHECGGLGAVWEYHSAADLRTLALATPAASTSTEGFLATLTEEQRAQALSGDFDDSGVICGSTEEALRAENAAVATAIGSPRFMDPPDGGDVSLAEQVSRMRQALEQAEAENARLREAAQAVLDAETVDVHVGYDGAAGGGNFVYADAIRTDDEAFDKLRSALSR